MRLRGCGAIAVFLLMAGLVRSQQLGQECGRQDGTRGICRNIRECVTQNGHVESANKVHVCDTSSLNRIIACCRKTPAIIARTKCDKWKTQANADSGPFCKVNIPLARGGTPADIGEFPHIVSLLRQSPEDGRLSHICGGVLISNDYVLTAAHCLGDNSRLVVRIGGHDLRDSEPGVTVDAEVARKILHPQYQQPRKYNDIALLKLRFEVTFSKRVRPACLPISNSRIQAGTKLVVAGWGKYENAGSTSDVLRKAEVTAIDRFTCDNNQDLDSASFHEYPVGITDSIICADESDQGPCSGDSGGPLMFDTTTTCEVKEVVGIVSRGIPECKRTSMPGTYTRIEFYVDWIVKTIWPNKLN